MVSQEVPVEVIDTFERRGRRGGSSYHLVARWPDSRGSDDMRLTAEEYSWMQHVTCAQVEWHQGRFGYGWISGYQGSCADASQVER